MSGSPRPAILIHHERGSRYEELLRSKVPTASVAVSTDDDQLRRYLPQAEVLVAQRFPPELLASAPQLRWVQLTSAGVEFLVPAADQLGSIVVTNARGVHGAIMSEYVFADCLPCNGAFQSCSRIRSASSGSGTPSLRWREER